MKQSSIFDIISPVMTGPSSSHTAGAVRLGLLAANIYNAKFDKVEFTLYNSYAKTGKGHGTDKGLLAGVLGLKVDDAGIKNIFNLPCAKNVKYSFIRKEDLNRHPNAVDIKFSGETEFSLSGASVGAGNIVIDKICDFKVEITGQYDTLTMIYSDVPGMISEVTGIIQKENINIASLICDRTAKGEKASMSICLDGFPSDKTVEEISKLKGMEFVARIRKIQ